MDLEGLILRDVTRMNNASAIYAVASQLLLLLHWVLVELEKLFYVKFAGECLMYADILAEELMHSGIGLPGSIE
jgi:hypothetical protein